MNDKQNFNIVIIGAGISGLSLALALIKKGFKVRVYEKAPMLNEVGAGLWVQPNAIKVLKSLGVHQKVIENGIQIHNVNFTNDQLVPFRTIDSNMLRIVDDNGIIAIHRFKLQEVLFNALPENTVQFNKTYVKHTTKSSKVQIHFQNEFKEADIIIGADGINSKVRNVIFPLSKIRETNQVCWRGIAEINFGEHFINEGFEAMANKQRFGFSHLEDQKVYWYAVVNKKVCISSNNQARDFLLNKFRSFDKKILNIIKNTSEDKLIKKDLADLQPLKTWHQNRTCLIGDAAHATTPNLGQGACQGIEDAYYLANLLDKESNHKSAFFLFEKVRRKKVKFIVSQSRLFGDIIHTNGGHIIFKLATRLMSTSAFRKRFSKIFHVLELD